MSTVLGDYVTSDVVIDELPDENAGTGGDGYELDGAADVTGDHALETAWENTILGEAVTGDTVVE